MSENKLSKDSQPSTVKGFMAMPSTQKRVVELLGDRSSQFMTSVSSMIGADDKLAKCEPVSLFMACLTAAALDLPINKNLGFAHIIPYDNKRAGVTEAQFQMGWKGYVQLAKRSGQYKSIAVTEVYEGQLIDEDPLDGNTYDWKGKTSDLVIGYVAKFKEIKGFEKELFMSTEDIKKHALKYSQSYKSNTQWVKDNSPWTTNFDAMAKKTVVKLLLNAWATLSVELQEAVKVDQAVIKENGHDYIDGDILESNVDANTDEKNAILEANGVPAQSADDEPDIVVDPDTGEVIPQEQSSLIEDEPKKPNYKEVAKKRYNRK